MLQGPITGKDQRRSQHAGGDIGIPPEYYGYSWQSLQRIASPSLLTASLAVNKWRRCGSRSVEPPPPNIVIMTIERETLTTPTRAATAMAGMATSMLQEFKPINNIKMYFNSIHGYADTPRRQVIADHFCGHVTKDLRQCLIYDTQDEKTARLIGVEYIISRPMFEALPAEEKKYWHSHAYEVKSGLLVMPRVPDVMERHEMGKLANTYGKTWHFWQVDRGDPLPYGEPKLMCSMLKDGMVDPNLLAKRDRRLDIDTEKIRGYRVEIEAPPPHPLADQFLKRSP